MKKRDGFKKNTGIVDFDWSKYSEIGLIKPDAVFFLNSDESLLDSEMNDTNNHHWKKKSKNNFLLS